MSPMLAVLLAAAPVSFDEAMSLAQRTPRVDAAKTAVTERLTLERQVGKLGANPSLGVQPGVRSNKTGSGFEVLGSVSQPFNVSGFGEARKEALARERQHDETDVRVEAHSARLMVAGAWLEVWAAQGVLREARLEREAAAELGQRTARAAEKGALTRADAATMQAWVAEAHLAELSAEGELFDRGCALNRDLGRDAAQPAAVVDALPEVARPSEDLLARSLESAERAPKVQRAASLARAETARAQEIVASKGTWLQVGALGGREGLGDVIGLATLSVTLPTFEHGEREAAPLLAAAARAEGERRAELADARAERVMAAHEVEHTAETLAVIENELMPAVLEAAKAAERRVEAGEATSQEWVLARRAALAAKSRLVRAKAEFALAKFRALELAAATEEKR